MGDSAREEAAFVPLGEKADPSSDSHPTQRKRGAGWGPRSARLVMTISVSRLLSLENAIAAWGSWPLPQGASVADIRLARRRVDMQRLEISDNLPDLRIAQLPPGGHAVTHIAVLHQPVQIALRGFLLHTWRS